MFSDRCLKSHSVDFGYTLSSSKGLNLQRGSRLLTHSFLASRDYI